MYSSARNQTLRVDHGRGGKYDKMQLTHWTIYLLCREVCTHEEQKQQKKWQQLSVNKGRREGEKDLIPRSRRARGQNIEVGRTLRLMPLMLSLNTNVRTKLLFQQLGGFSSFRLGRAKQRGFISHYFLRALSPFLPLPFFYFLSFLSNSALCTPVQNNSWSPFFHQK